MVGGGDGVGGEKVVGGGEGGGEVGVGGVAGGGLVVGELPGGEGVAGFGVDIQALKDQGIIKKELDGVKILGNGEFTKKLTVKANAFSASAKEKIEALGGTTEVI